MPIQFTFSRDFIRDVKQLRKRFRRIEDDIDSLLEEIEDTGYRGDRVRHVGEELYKAGLSNISSRRGKSGGFRAIYLHEDEDALTFLHIYSKSDKNDVSASEIMRMLRNLE